MNFVTWTKRVQDIKQVQKISVSKFITLTCELNIVNILRTYKDIIDIKKFKKLTIFQTIFKRNRKILKLNKFWFKNIARTMILRRDRFEIVIYEIKIKEIVQNIKNEKEKIMKKTWQVIPSGLQIKKIEWLVKKSEKKVHINNNVNIQRRDNEQIDIIKYDFKIEY